MVDGLTVTDCKGQIPWGFLQCYGYLLVGSLDRKKGSLGSVAKCRRKWCMVVNMNWIADIMGFWSFPDVRHQIHSICMLSSQVWYLPWWRISRPEISESWKLHELLFLALVDCHNLKSSNTLSCIAIVTISLFIKEMLIRRQMSKWDVDYLLLLLLVEVRWICASSHPLVTCLYGTVGSKERKALNKATP